MTGTILNYNMQNSEGIISGSDGQRYSFTNIEWKEEQAPTKGLQVDFETSGKHACGIYLALRGSSPVTNFISSDLEWLKSTDQKMLAGVCGGIATKFDVSISACRLLTAVLSLFFLFPIVIYIVLWLILPSGPTKHLSQQK